MLIDAFVLCGPLSVLRVILADNQRSSELYTLLLKSGRSGLWKAYTKTQKNLHVLETVNVNTVKPKTTYYCFFYIL